MQTILAISQELTAKSKKIKTKWQKILNLILKQEMV
jgi:hypothetical protein